MKQWFVQLSFSQIGNEIPKKKFSNLCLEQTVTSKRGTNNLLYLGIEEALSAVKVRFLDLHRICKDIQT